MSSTKPSLLIIIPSFFYVKQYQRMLYYNDIPAGTLQLASFLKTKVDLEVDLIDIRVEEENIPSFQQDVPDLLEYGKALDHLNDRENLDQYQCFAINCYTSYQYRQTELIAHYLKKEFPNIPIIVGGYHPTAKPEDFCYKKSPYDYIIRGEAELSFKELFNSDKTSLTLPKSPIILNNSPNPININDLPFADYELYLHRYPYQDKFRFSLYLSRGCPYQCAFCATNYQFRLMNLKLFKQRINKLIEIVDQYNPHLPKISFSDQSFNRLLIKEDILSYILEVGLNETFSFSCQSRVEAFANDLDLIDKFRKCNMIIGFGLESVNANLLREMHKTTRPNRYVENIKQVIEKYRNEPGTHCRLNILAGFPGEDHQKFMETVEFINENALHEDIQISPTLFSNYPNVHVYDHMSYYREKYGAEFIQEWWKLDSNPFINSIPERPSRNYSKSELILDYRDYYLSILKASKLNNFSELVIWKGFFNNVIKTLKK